MTQESEAGGDPGFKLIPLSGKHGEGKFAVVDAEDFERLARYVWHSCSGYAARKSRNSDGPPRRTIFMHNEVAPPPPGLEVDHKLGIKLDNRKSELRHVTHQVNLQNRAFIRSDERGFKGVSHVPNNGSRHKPWETIAFMPGGGKVGLGYYATQEEGARIYDAFIRYYYDSNTFTNFSDTDEALSLEQIQERLHQRRLSKKTSKYLGVYFQSQNNNWVARFKLNGSSHHIGVYQMEEEAARARDAKVKELRLKRRLNFPNE